MSKRIVGVAVELFFLLTDAKRIESACSNLEPLMPEGPLTTARQRSSREPRSEAFHWETTMPEPRQERIVHLHHIGETRTLRQSKAGPSDISIVQIVFDVLGSARSSCHEIVFNAQR